MNFRLGEDVSLMHYNTAINFRSQMIKH